MPLNYNKGRTQMFKFKLLISFLLYCTLNINVFALEPLNAQPIYDGPRSPNTNNTANSGENETASRFAEKSQVIYRSEVPKLSRLLSEYTTQSNSNILKSGDQNFSNPLVKLNSYKEVQIYVTLKQLDEYDIQELQSYGLTIDIKNYQLKKVQGWISADKLDSLSGIDNIVSITTPNYPTVRKGSVNSEGDSLLKTEELAQLGYSGKGVRIGIISDGANNWQEAAQSGDLPENITTYGVCNTGNTGQTEDLCNRTSGTCNEGTAMAEIIHEIAPDAELAVASVNTSLEFIEQINVLINDFKADIIIDDLAFLGEPTFYDGDIANAIKSASNKVLFVSSAGNSGYGHYIPDDYELTTSVDIMDSVNTFTPSLVHDFGQSGNSSDDPYHGFIIPANSATTIVANWDGRIASVGLSRSLIQLRIHNIEGLTVYKNDLISLTSANEAVTGVCIPNTSNENQVYFATVQFYNKTSPFRLFFLGGGAIEYPISKSSVYGHSAVERVIAVGAINASEFDTEEVTFYSSRGPSVINHVLDPSSLSIVNLEYQELRKKPDLVAVDGVSVTGTGGFPQTFFGTSASAPHVAGVAAQLMSVSPFVKASDTRRALLLGARDISVTGFDYNSGYGIVSPIGALSNLVFGNPMPAIYLLLDEE